MAGLFFGLAVTGAARALTPEQATEVGGELKRMDQSLGTLGERTAAVRSAVARIVDAAPQVGDELVRAHQQMAGGRGMAELAGRSAMSLGVLLILILLVLACRRLTVGWRRACIDCPVRARGAVGLAALDMACWGVFAVGAYLSARYYYDGQDPQALLQVAVLSGLVRAFILWQFLGILLRPDLPDFRLIAMSDRAAARTRLWFSGAATFGFLAISVMPVLLRLGLSIPAGQLLVLGQGLIVAAGCMLGLMAYRRDHPAPGPRQRFWLWLGAIGIPLTWLVWNLGVVALEFAAYHSLVYSLRIALIAYAVHAVLELSAREFGWYRLVQHATTAAAVLALSILLSELWLVERLGLVAPAAWLPVRQSLQTTALTLFVGFVAWRYLYLWTEERLRAASPGLAPGIDDDIAAEPASRLTTILPMVRVVVGVGILIAVAFLGLSQLGMDVTTLLAGAGVFGLALSFGSQALVRDIVSGLFFLSDDAFRVGEYIDTGRLKGTVERVTLRSVRLRHQNGQIHTIPFGQLNAITNYSRDWQTVKFNLRLARDTDLEKTRKTVKRVGQELMQDAEFGQEFLLPLKLQGMVEVTDSALVVRLKFTVRPSNPSIIQREALKRLHRTFAAEGIEFAAGVITVKPAAEGASTLALAAAAAAGQAGHDATHPAAG